MTSAMPVTSGMPTNLTSAMEGNNIAIGETLQGGNFSHAILALLSQMLGTQNSAPTAGLPGSRLEENARVGENLLQWLQGLQDTPSTLLGPQASELEENARVGENLLQWLQGLQDTPSTLLAPQASELEENARVGENLLQWLQGLQDAPSTLLGPQANGLEEWKKYLPPAFGVPMGAFQPQDTNLLPNLNGNHFLTAPLGKGVGQNQLPVNPLSLASFSDPSASGAANPVSSLTGSVNVSALPGLFGHGLSGNGNSSAFPLVFLQTSAPMTFMTMKKLDPQTDLLNKAIAPLEGSAMGGLSSYVSLAQIPMPYAQLHGNPAPMLPPSNLPFVAMPMTPPSFSQDLSDRLQWMEKVGLSSMRLNLNPPQLGNLQVVITVNDVNQGAHIQFLASTPQMVQTLTNHFGDLRDQLASFGFNNMSFDVGHRQNSESQREFQSSSQGRQRYQLAEEDVLPIVRMMPAHNGRVDDYA